MKGLLVLLSTVMPSEMSGGRTRLKPQEAALLAGELKKPTWESRNEGIHERVSFEDSIWGFDLAGGSYYKTPLRVTAVKPDSRADKAGIRPGDRLLRINDIDTSTLTIQEAHAIIIESGVHLRLAVTAPEDLEDSYHCWEDALEDGYDSEEERRLEKERIEKRQVHCKVSSFWSLQWPWVSKRRVIYRESNCFMVPSKYEGKHKDKFVEQPIMKTTDDVVLYSKDKEENLKYKTDKTPPQTPILNGDTGLPEFSKTDSEDGEPKLPSDEISIREEVERHGKENEVCDQEFLEICEGNKEKVSEKDEEDILDGILNDEHKYKIEDKT